MVPFVVIPDTISETAASCTIPFFVSHTKKGNKKSLRPKKIKLGKAFKYQGISPGSVQIAALRSQ
jgi:hypothetical protein